MADIRHRFDNTPFGGAQNVTLQPSEMPDWYANDQVVKENFHRGDNGKAWKYTWYRKDSYTVSFRGVATHLVATFGSIASEGVAFLFYKDTSVANSGTGTYVYSGGAFVDSPFAPNLTDFDFSVERLS